MELKVSIDSEFQVAFLYLCGKLYEIPYDRAENFVKVIREALNQDATVFRRPPKRPTVITHFWGVSVGECVHVRQKLAEKGLLDLAVVVEDNAPSI